MKRAISRSKYLIFVTLSLSLLFISCVSAEENDSSSKLENMGFMKNPPKELKDKFPMCDEFLKVKWIDKNKRIGISEYDFYINGHKAGKTTAIIYLGKFNPQFNLEGVYFKSNQNQGGPGVVQEVSKKYQVPQQPIYIKSISKKKLAELINDIKQGVLAKNSSFEEVSGIEYKGKLISLLQIGNEEKSFADNRENVCIAYPDNQLMWMAEIKTVEKIYDAELTLAKYSQLESLKEFKLPVNSVSAFKSQNTIDLNFDGVDDYLYYESIIYSHNSGYYQMRRMWEYESDSEYGKWDFLPIGNVCEIEMPSSLKIYLTTDGKSYFLSNQCNLSKLTQ